MTIEELAEYAGTSVAKLEQLADRLPKGDDFTTNVYTAYNRGRREIVVPTTALDTITKNLHRSFVIELPYDPPSHVHGFVKGRSPFTNAAQHLNKACVLRVDLQEFFPSIDSVRVNEALLSQGLESNAAELCTRIVTIRGRLPIGLSTSPLMSNISFENTDYVLAKYCTSEGLTFTRYVDDMIFSGDVAHRNLHDIAEILAADGWLVNHRKTIFMRRGGPQYVTGLFVGCRDRPRIPRRIKRQMRRVCYLIEKFGYPTYMQKFGGDDARMVPNRLFGWARHIASIEPSIGYPMLRSLSENVPENHPHSNDRSRSDPFGNTGWGVIELVSDL